MTATASIYSLADEHRSRAESAAWSRFACAAGDAEWYASWLELLAARVQRAQAGLLLVGDEAGTSFAVAAAWPSAARDLRHLSAVAERALGERRGVVAGPDGQEPQPEFNAHVGYPIELGSRLCAVVVLELGAGNAAELQAVLRQIHWASAWLVDHFRARLQRQDRAEADRMALLNTLLACALQHRHIGPSSLAVANELAARLQCDRVSIGFDEAGRVKPAALSHTATFDERSDLVRRLGEAMDEALDLGIPVQHPAEGDGEVRALAHAGAARALQVDAMLSVPLMDACQPIGVITLERTDGPAFDAEAVRVARAAGVALGPAWALQRLNGRTAWQRLGGALRAGAVAVAGPRYPGWKMVAGLAVLALALLLLVRVDHRVSARTTIEGATQVAAAAPFEGFIAAGLVRAGETVRRGQPLARLDDRELKLERARWYSEREQLQRKHQLAMAGADRSAMGVYEAQMQQAQAQLALAEDKLARAVVTAPFDGLVVSGDLSQLAGAPVEQGRTLFEVAPLDGYRVVLQVDDREIGRIALGQRGELVLSGLPGNALPFRVQAITPVSSQQDGRNVFRVEAQLDVSDPARLRPGMEGVGKIVVGKANLLWIWTHEFVTAVQLALWNWTP